MAGDSPGIERPIDVLNDLEQTHRAPLVSVTGVRSVSARHRPRSGRTDARPDSVHWRKMEKSHSSSVGNCKNL